MAFYAQLVAVPGTPSMGYSWHQPQASDMNDISSLNYWRFFPRRNEHCLCGSGRKFELCCKEAIVTNLPRGDMPFRYIPRPSRNIQGDDRTRIYRARFSQERLRHLAFMDRCRAAGLPDDPIPSVSANATADAVMELLVQLLTTGRTRWARLLVEQAAGFLRSTEWDARYSYVQAQWELWRNEPDYSKARKHLEAVDVDDVDHCPTLRLWLALCGEGAGITKEVKVCSRIVELSESDIEKARYTIQEAVIWAANGNRQEALQRAADVHTYLAEVDVEPSDMHGWTTFAWCLSAGGSLIDPETLSEYESRLFSTISNVIATDDYDDFLIQGAHSTLADLHRSRGRWNEAEHHYRVLTTTDDSFLNRMWLGEVLARNGKYDQGAEILLGLSHNTQRRETQFDYCLALGIAASTTDSAVRERLLSRIAEVKENLELPAYPLLRERMASLDNALLRWEGDRLRRMLSELQDEVRAERESAPSIHDVRQALATLPQLQPATQAQVAPGQPDLRGMVAGLLSSLCLVVLDQRYLLAPGLRSHEDAYTAQLALLLEQRTQHLGWVVQFQSRGGHTGSASDTPEAGIRDIVLRKAGGAPFAIVEALRMSNIGRSGLRTAQAHLDKTCRKYDPGGKAHLFVVVLAEVQGWNRFSEIYKRTWSSIGTDGEFGGSVDTQRAVARCSLVFDTCHEMAGQQRIVTHLVFHAPRV